jgi:hypothetical protein
LVRQGKVETYFWGASALAKAAEHPLLPRGTPVVYPTSPALARARS